MNRLMQKLRLEKNSRYIIDQIQQDLSSSEESVVMQRIMDGKIGFNHHTFDKYRKIQQEIDEYIVNPFEIEEGILSCHKCQSKRVFSTSVQTRAADEPMTTIAQCAKCKHKWSHNG